MEKQACGIFDLSWFNTIIIIILHGDIENNIPED